MDEGVDENEDLPPTKFQFSTPGFMPMVHSIDNAVNKV